MTTGYEEIHIKFYVDHNECVLVNGAPQWCLLIKDVNKEGGCAIVAQRWDHEPTQEEVTSAIFAARQGMGFLTLHLATKRPKRYVQVAMPCIRVNVVDAEEALT